MPVIRALFASTRQGSVTPGDYTWALFHKFYFGPFGRFLVGLAALFRVAGSLPGELDNW